ncbi:radical SAM protein [Thermosulfurimonas sp. F29]|uniref:radical SAM protein n=1 Tax=Thermosulfurimonas sp. F29 TaxID=2867247 RepID=UPI001C82D2BA|nr:radical SAM protein [Thermosulfurimonas sp. F29]MBX6422461.1 radical SAM protein [Thermosulfurimonas sp. F29]
MPVFGPVRSRRLGLSLGVDLVPYKICSMDCVYCEVGRTTTLTLEIREYRPFKEISSALRRALEEKEFDVVTLTGSGEPTLNSCFPEVVELIREITEKPLAVLTNSTTLNVPGIFNALCESDYVLASLDAARPESLRRVNRPVPGLHPEALVEGLSRLRENMRGELWLEILLVKGINDQREDIEALRAAVERIRPHRIQLNTVARPPAESWAKPLSAGELMALSRELGAEVIAPRRVCRTREEIPEETEILAYLSRRPAPVEELAEAFGIPPEKIEKILKELVRRDLLKGHFFGRRIFYRINPEL